MLARRGRRFYATAASQIWGDSAAGCGNRPGRGRLRAGSTAGGLAIARNIKGDITRQNFLKAVHGQTFDLGGLKLDFTKSNRGSNLGQLAYLSNGEFKSITSQKLVNVFQKADSQIAAKKSAN